MARIRSVHPGLFTDESFVSASVQARLLMIGLWTEADDSGIFEWKPLSIKMRIFPADTFDVAPILAELEGLNVIRKYEIASRNYGAIRNFCKYQRPKSPTSVWDMTDEISSYVGTHLREEDPTMALKRRLLRKSGDRCTYCKTPIVAASKRANSVEIDHAVPKARGGSDTEENLVAACRTCNRQKGMKTADEFMRIVCESIPAPRDKHTQSGDFSGDVATGSATSEVAPQMEDGGWRMEDGEKKESTPSVTPVANRVRCSEPDPVIVEARKAVALAYTNIGQMPPDTSRVPMWIESGFTPDEITSCITAVLARGTVPTTLKYFDKALADIRTAPRAPPHGQAAPKKRGSAAILEALNRITSDGTDNPAISGGAPLSLPSPG